MRHKPPRRDPILDCHLRVQESLLTPYASLIRRYHWSESEVYRTFIQHILADEQSLLDIMLGASRSARAGDVPGASLQTQGTKADAAPALRTRSKRGPESEV